MVSQHTPGPWTIIKESNDAVIRYSDGELASYVARIYDAALCPEHGTVDANARLIAAAPVTKHERDELLAVIKRMLARIQSEGVICRDGDSDSLLLRDARALLARIEEG